MNLTNILFMILGDIMFTLVPPYYEMSLLKIVIFFVVVAIALSEGRHKNDED